MDGLVTLKTYTVGQDTPGKLLVSLPPVWLEKNNVIEGDLIEFMQAPGSTDLIIRKITPTRKLKTNAASC